MKTKFLLLCLLLSGGFLYAQDIVRYLVISEIRMDDARRSYVEVANVGTEDINLGDFTIGKIEPWSAQTVNEGVWDTKLASPQPNYWVKFPDMVLAPGETYMIAMVYDWGPEMWLTNPVDYGNKLTKKEMWTLPDLKLHYDESPTNMPSDSVTPQYHLLEVWGQGECFYLRQNIYEDIEGVRTRVDSVMIDQVNGIWKGADGTRNGDGQYPDADVAGFTGATQTATLIRKFAVKEGNLDFETGRGQDASESEWIAIPHQKFGTADHVARLFWTAKNHGDYNLTADYLVPLNEDVVVDYAGGTITVPWGIRRDDSIMFQMEYKPGIAWHYSYNDVFADSAKMSACTGDTLTVYVAGNDMDMKKFKIIVTPPGDDAKIVIPKKQANNDGFFDNVEFPTYSVSDGNEVDTIGHEFAGGLYYGTRIDTLVNYLEFPPNTTWDVEWVGGDNRAELVDGDKLVVTAADGSKKSYYIKVNKYFKSHNAFLNVINWPDIPVDLKNTYGFLGDTIPNFVSTVYNYALTVPTEIDAFPALVARKQVSSSKVEVTRASSLDGSIESRTLKFHVVAEDDTTTNDYTVQVNREITTANRELYTLDPFISQFVWQEQWANAFMEVVNPGSADLDLSHYMFAWGYANTPAEAITRNSAADAWLNRYCKYIPGYRWVDETTWASKPATVVPDNVNPIVRPGDVFVMGDVWDVSRFDREYPDDFNEREVTYDENNNLQWWATKQCDVEFSTGRNPWGEETSNWNGMQQWNGANWYLFKIINDSILEGLKPANDPGDFVLIDVFGSGDGSAPVVGGVQIMQIANYIRKPDITQGNPVFRGSFGTDAATSEWTMTNLAYYDALQTPWPYNRLNVTEDLGKHFMRPTTKFLSTVTSPYFTVSPGYGEGESIDGIVTGMTVDEVLKYLVKKDPAQALLFKHAGDTLKLGTDVITSSDTLIVTSAEQEIKTYYELLVGEGLGRDATLASEVYTVSEEGATGIIEGIEPGTTLSEVLGDVTKAEGAQLTVLDGSGAYLAKRTFGPDSVYRNTLVDDNTYFEVVSESRFDTIKYKLELVSSVSTAYVISSVYVVEPEKISMVTYGTTAAGFLANLVPSKGATMVLYDKLGTERLWGNVASDDVLAVTSEDGTFTTTYFVNFIGGPVAVFVTSLDYIVDQADATIVLSVLQGENVSVATFLAGLTPSAGAVAELLDADYAPKPTGNLASGDIVVVTSADGKITKEYEVTIFTGVRNDNMIDMVVYPNPSKGRIFVSGLSAGQKILVHNIIGAMVYQKPVLSAVEEFSMEGQKSGMYTITIMDNDKVVGRSKFVKE